MKTQCCGDKTDMAPMKDLRAHVRGHTNLSTDFEKICEDCLHELMMDSIWTIGFMSRLKFLKAYEDDFMPSSLIVSSGYQSLSYLCAGCNKPHVNGSAQWLAINDSEPQHRRYSIYQNKFCKDLGFNEKYAENYYGWMWCEECTKKIEKSFVKNIRAKDLAKHDINSWLTDEAREYFIRKLKGETA